MWNMAFTIGNLPFFNLTKLLIPSVHGYSSHPSHYFFYRTISLHTQCVLAAAQQNKIKIRHENLPKAALPFGNCSLSAILTFLGEYNNRCCDDFSTKLASLHEIQSPLPSIICPSSTHIRSPRLSELAPTFSSFEEKTKKRENEKKMEFVVPPPFFSDSLFSSPPLTVPKHFAQITLNSLSLPHQLLSLLTHYPSFPYAASLPSSSSSSSSSSPPTSLPSSSILSLFQLCSSAVSVGKMLQKHYGIMKGDRVGLVFFPSTDVLIAFWGCLLIGGFFFLFFFSPVFLHLQILTKTKQNKTKQKKKSTAIPICLPPPLRLAADLPTFSAILEKVGASIVLSHKMYQSVSSKLTIQHRLQVFFFLIFFLSHFYKNINHSSIFIYFFFFFFLGPIFLVNKSRLAINYLGLHRRRPPFFFFLPPFPLLINSRNKIFLFRNSWW